MNVRWMFLACFVMNMQALKLDRVILATDAHPDYIEFWPVVAKAWKEIIGIQPTLALIAHADVQIDESLGDVIRFEPIEGIPTSLQAQVIRLLLPALYPDDVCIISDIDMIPLNKEYFTESIRNCPDDSFVVYRDKAYHAGSLTYPMCYFAARGSVFQEVFQTYGLQDIAPMIQKLYALNIGWHTDEIVLYDYLHGWSGFEARCIKLGHYVEKRIDRSYWMHDQRLLRSGYYIDAHCPRPYSQYKACIDELVYVPDTRLGKIMMSPYNEYLLRARQPLGDLDATGEINLIRCLINKGDVVFDVGANCGDWTRAVLAHTSPKKIYAFEPIPAVADAFKQHIDNDCVSLYELAVSNTCGSFPFFYYPSQEGLWEDGVLSSLYRRARVEDLFKVDGYEINVPTVTLDEFCAEHQVDSIRFLKIDTEGAEYDILQGAKALLLAQKIDFIQFEYGQTYTDSKRTLKEVYEFLTQCGYVIFKVHRNGIIHVKRWFDLLEDFYQSNFVAVSAEITKHSKEFEALMNVEELPKRCFEQGDSGTHMSFLLTAVAHTNGPILEMGAGDYSTPLLHAVCSRDKRCVLSADTDRSLLFYFLDLQCNRHAFAYVPVYEDDWSLNPQPDQWDAVGAGIHWSVVLINHRPGERRVKDIERLRPHTEIFVVHDTQEASYGYQPLLDSFKYKYVDERYATQTTMVSDVIDVTQFFREE